MGSSAATESRRDVAVTRRFLQMFGRAVRLTSSSMRQRAHRRGLTAEFDVGANLFQRSSLRAKYL